MGRQIKLALVYRDMWQSSGKYVPRVDQLTRVAQPIIDVGCFSRIETNGGGFEQVNLLFGENPNKAVRDWTQPFNDAGIQTQMLERALNGIRMSPVPADVRRLMFKVKKKQGTDISRSFCGLNDPRNMANSIKFAKEGGMISQAALSLTFSPVHTVDYYINLAEQYIELGADEICIKDMAGIGRPASVGRIVKGIKNRHPKILVQYHGHSTTGFSIVSSLEAARAGADIIDVGMEPLSWGTGHADLLAVHEMLKDAGFLLPDINMDAYMEVRRLCQEFMDDFLGYYINERNRRMNSLLIGPGLPGGMMGSLMADLEKNLSSLNKWMRKNNKKEVSQDELLIKLFKEVQYVWPRLGYPPLVTPYSQYVKNVSLRNVVEEYKGRDKWKIDESTWGMILGKSGKLPGRLSNEIIGLAAEEGRQFYDGLPQDLYPNQLDFYRKKMDEKNWAYGEDEEELMEYAMHPKQYEEYRSGVAKKNFEADLAKRKAAKNPPTTSPVANSVPVAASSYQPKTMTINVNGEKYKVSVEYDDEQPTASSTPTSPTHIPSTNSPSNVASQEILSPLEGKFYLTQDASQKALKVGDRINKGDKIAYIEAMKVSNAVTSEKSGIIVEVCFSDGQEVEEDDVIFKLK